MSTKTRILETSLAMFNQLGSGNITSLDIAAELEISPGNLYYHFKGKEEIIARLSKECELAIGKLLGRLDMELISEREYWVFLKSLLTVCLHYRFLFMDFQSFEAGGVGQKGSQRLLNQLRRFTDGSLTALMDKGLLEIKGSARSELSENLFLLGLSWLCFEANQAQVQDEQELVEKGAHRLISLVEPHLSRRLQLADND